jgi:hypothetical protein
MKFALSWSILELERLNSPEYDLPQSNFPLITSLNLQLPLGSPLDKTQDSLDGIKNKSRVKGT